MLYDNLSFLVQPGMKYMLWGYIFSELLIKCLGKRNINISEWAFVSDFNSYNSAWVSCVLAFNCFKLMVAYGVKTRPAKVDLTGTWSF